MHHVRSVARRSALAGLAAFGVALSLFFAIGGLRLWPRISGQHLPLSLIWPFARPLLAAGLELAFLVSVPVALGIVASMRAARTPVGASWQATACATALLLVELGPLSFGVSSWLDGRGSSPGQLATELVASARESCTESAQPAEVAVPLLGFAWVCRAGSAPRLRGRAPIGKFTTFEASAITLSEDLKRIALDGFTLALSISSLKLQGARQARDVERSAAMGSLASHAPRLARVLVRAERRLGGVRRGSAGVVSPLATGVGRGLARRGSVLLSVVGSGLARASGAAHDRLFRAASVGRVRRGAGCAGRYFWRSACGATGDGAPVPPLNLEKKLNKHGYFASRLLDLSHGGTRRGPPADAGKATVFTAESRGSKAEGAEGCNRACPELALKATRPDP